MATGSPAPTMPVVIITPTDGIGDVHRAALAPAGPGALPEQLAEELAERDTLGELVVKTPVGRDEVVVGPQGRGHPGRQHLLAPGRVVEAEELAGGDEIPQRLVDRPDPGRASPDGQERPGTAVCAHSHAPPSA